MRIMKTIKFFIVVTTLFCYSLSKAQMIDLTPAQWLGVHKKYIQSATYIFEGAVIKQNHYYVKNQVVYISIIQITKIFKGSPQLKLGSIKVITAQAVNGDNISDGERLVEISKRGTYIIFCKPTNPSLLIDSTVTDNTITLTQLNGMDYPIVISGKDAANWVGTPQFKTKEDIYSFFKENGLTLQEEAK